MNARVAVFAVAALLLAGEGGMADPLPAPAKGRPALTGKERLGSKAADEQRVDNCKVPPEKRGPKPRPADCPADRRPVDQPPR